jgi:hypothetical protein
MAINKTASGSGYVSERKDGAKIANELTRDLMTGPLGLTFEQASGLVGNLAVESANFTTYNEMNPIVPGSRGGAGWAQWTGPRRSEFEAWASAKNLPLDSYAASLGFIEAEMLGQVPNSNETRALDMIRSATSIRQAADLARQYYERPGIPHAERRRDVAEDFAKPFVKEAQKSLAALGYDVAVDGVLGPETQAAINSYHNANFFDERLGAKTLGSLSPSFRGTQRQAEERSMIGLADYLDNRSIRQTELDSMRQLSIMEQANKAANARLGEQLSKYQPGRGGRQQNMARPTGDFVGSMPAARSVPSAAMAEAYRAAENFAMQALADYRKEPLKVATPPERAIGSLPAARGVPSADLAQSARASELKSMSDLAGIVGQKAGRRADLAQAARAAENASMAGLASMQGAIAGRRADLAQQTRASENQSMRANAAREGKIAEGRAVYAPAARAAENKSMQDLERFQLQRETEKRALQAQQARASENQSMRALQAYRSEPLKVATPPERAIGSMPAAKSVPSAPMAQAARASENKSMQNLAMDKATQFSTGPTKERSQAMNARGSMLSQLANRQQAALETARTLTANYGAYGQSRAAAPAVPTGTPGNMGSAGYGPAPFDAIDIPGSANKPGFIAAGSPMAKSMASVYGTYKDGRVAAPAQPVTRNTPAPAAPQPQAVNTPQFPGNSWPSQRQAAEMYNRSIGRIGAVGPRSPNVAAPNIAPNAADEAAKQRFDAAKPGVFQGIPPKDIYKEQLGVPVAPANPVFGNGFRGFGAGGFLGNLLTGNLRSAASIPGGFQLPGVLGIIQNAVQRLGGPQQAVQAVQTVAPALGQVMGLPAAQQAAKAGNNMVIGRDANGVLGWVADGGLSAGAANAGWMSNNPERNFGGYGGGYDPTPV